VATPNKAFSAVPPKFINPRRLSGFGRRWRKLWILVSRVSSRTYICLSSAIEVNSLLLSYIVRRSFRIVRTASSYELTFNSVVTYHISSVKIMSSCFRNTTPLFVGSIVNVSLPNYAVFAPSRQPATQNPKLSFPNLIITRLTSFGNFFVFA